MMTATKSNDLSKYDTYDLLCKLSYLQLNPENYKYDYCIQDLINEVLRSYTKSNKVIPDSVLKQLIQDAPGFIHPDPSQSLFASIFPFDGENYITFPDSSIDESNSLSNLLKAVSKLGNHLFTQKIYSFAHTLLAISNTIASKLNISSFVRYGSTKLSKNILPTSCILTVKELDSIVGKTDFELNELEKLICTEVDQTNKNDDIKINQAKPIIKFGDCYIVIYPKFLLATIRHFLIVEAKKANVMVGLLNHLKLIASARIIREFHFLGFKHSRIELPDLTQDSDHEIVLEFDINKACYIQFITDDCSEYYDQNPFPENPVIKDVESKYKDHHDQVIEKVLEEYDEVLLLIINIGVGRYGSCFPYFGRTSKKVLSCVVSFDEIIAYLSQEDLDNLSLYKFIDKFAELKSQTEVWSTSFLDVVASYRSCNQSFNLRDEELPHLIMLGFGEGTYLAENAHINPNFHYVPTNQNSEGPVLVKKLNPNDDKEYIYVCTDGTSILSLNRILCEDFHHPIWIQSSEEAFLVIRTLATYLHQLKNQLESHINTIGLEVINLSFNTCKTFSFDVSNNIINLNVPILNSFDENLVYEKKLLDVLLASISELATSNHSEITMLDKQKIIDQYYESENRILIHNLKSQDNPRLMPLYDSTRVRFIKQHDIESKLDNLAIKVHAIAPDIPTDQIIKGDARKDFINAILTVFKDEILEIVKKYKRQPLLNLLVGIYESIVWERSYIDATGPSTAICFSSVVQRAAEIAKLEAEKFETNAFGIRFLIEFIIGTEFNGDIEYIPDSELDDLVVTGYQYVHWGIVGQNIRCKIFGDNDYEFAFLGSNRIGVKQPDPLVIKHLKETKSLEALEGRIENHTINQSSLEQLLGKDAADLFNKGFEEEFDFTFDNFRNCIGSITEYALAKHIDIVHIKKSQLIDFVNRERAIDKNIVEKIIDSFSLLSRKRWEDIPLGYDENDLSPWIYKRRLSYNKRPLLQTNIDGEIFITYGYRQCHSIGYSWIYDILHANVQRKHFKSKTLQKFFGSIEDKNGSEFEDKIYNWINQNKPNNWRVLLRCKIAPRKFFNNSQDLGDIDILIIDENKKTLFICDCKDLNSARTAAEISSEITNLLEKEVKGRDKSYVAMHMQRIDWLISNWTQVQQKLDLKNSGWKIVPYILFSRMVPSTLIRQMPFPSVTFFDLKRNGVNLLRSFHKKQAKIAN